MLLCHAEAAMKQLAVHVMTTNAVCIGSADGEIRLWDIPSRRCLQRLVGHTGTPDTHAAVLGGLL